jgi:biotin synthase
MRPGSSYENRRQCLQWLKELGFETGAGNMIGLPGQCMTDLAMDLHYLNALQPDMIGIGPFIPHPETPLAQYPPGSSPLTLRVVALSRLLVPQANIPATTALGVLDKSGRINALHAGANVVMLDFTPVKYRRFYDIYPGKARALTEMDTYLPILREELAAIGRPVG